MGLFDYKSIPVWVHDEPYGATYSYKLAMPKSLFADLVNETKKETQMRYEVKNDASLVQSTWEAEKDAIVEAERLAKTFPGRTYYVMKPITKSYVAPAPAITTRL